MSNKIAIIGAGLTGLLQSIKYANNDDNIFIFEKENQLGGLCRTLKYNISNEPSRVAPIRVVKMTAIRLRKKL